ncbi:MAG: hypothetical protein HY675_26360 [Chloroflexi bacterium]|nr:hypothetical protein [Chloroflexota bacterium]
MRLEVATFEVKQVEFSHRTALSNGILTIDRGELKALIQNDDAIESTEIELARPGESTRIVRVLDAIEPLLKVKGSSCCFPGLLGPARTCGDGRTNRLKGLAVLESSEFPQPAGGLLSFSEGFIDMSGPAAARCACSDTFNVILLLKPREGTTNEQWDRTVRMAGMKTSAYLASTTRDQEPDREQAFELGSVDSSLPRVVYIDQVQEQGLLVHTLVYGGHVDNLLPTLLHPNEMLDGAVVSGNYKGGMRVATCIHTNNPIVKALYRRHGCEINFLGVVLSRGHHDDHRSKERSAQYAAKVARLLGAEGAIVSIEGTGNAMIDYMLTVKACEEAGIRTVALLHERGGPDGTDTPLIDFAPEADAMVTSGSIDRPVAMPRVDRVIGGTEARCTTGQIVDARGPFEALPIDLYCGFWQMGIGGLTAKDC